MSDPFKEEIDKKLAEMLKARFDEAQRQVYAEMIQHERDEAKAWAAAQGYRKSPVKSPDPKAVQAAVAKYQAMMQAMTKKNEKKAPPPEPEPHDPFDLVFTEIDRFLTGERVLEVQHKCPQPHNSRDWDDYLKNAQPLVGGQPWAPGINPPNGGFGQWTITTTGANSNPLANAGGALANAAGLGLSQATQQQLWAQTAQLAAQPMMGNHNHYSVNPKSYSQNVHLSGLAQAVSNKNFGQDWASMLGSGKSNILGKLMLGNPDDFDKIKDGVICPNCKAVITGSIMKMAYFRQLAEKL